jgi:hypothetical protein
MDRNASAAMALLAFLHSVLHPDRVLASATLDRVIDAAPCCGLAECLKSPTPSWRGEAQTAIFYAGQAETMPALGPERAWRDHVAAGGHYVAGRYSDAARWGRVSAMPHPGLAANARILAASLAMLGRLDEGAPGGVAVAGDRSGFRYRHVAETRDAAGGKPRHSGAAAAAGGAARLIGTTRRLGPDMPGDDGDDASTLAGILLISRAEAPTTLRAHQSALRVAGITVPAGRALAGGSGPLDRPIP